MIRLLIDNKEAVLPEGFSFTLYSENPIFNKSSDYTYDLTLSLENQKNARIYKNINRQNIVGDKIKKRRAVLIVDNKIRLKGIEIILDITDKSVKIQLASGNSELSYIVGGNRKLRNLDLGSAEYIDGEAVPPEVTKTLDIARKVYSLLKYSYPYVPHLLLPYAVSNSGVTSEQDEKLGNNFFLGQIFWHNPPESPDPNYYPYYNTYYSGQVPQPFFCFIISRVFTALGYKLIYNDIAEHPVLKNAYIVHGIQTLEYAKMLPDWTVEDFLSKIEFQFDCAFVIDSESKNVELLFNNQINKNDGENENKTTLKVLDEFTSTEDTENRLTPQIANIAYSLDSDEYYSFMSIDENVYKQARKQNISTISELFVIMKTSNLNDIKDVIFTDGYDEYIAYYTGETVDNKPHIIPKRINSFRPIYNNKDSTEIDRELDIIPAAMISKYQIAGYEFIQKFWYQIPVAGSYTPLWDSNESMDGSEERINLQSIIDGSESLKSDPNYTKMRLAIYGGLKELRKITSDTRKYIYPISYVESLCEYFEKTGIIEYYGPVGNDPFRLSNINRNIYSKTAIVNTTKTYKFIFKRPSDINIRDTFIINNKKYICNKIEQEVTINGFSEYVTGYFYPKE